MLKFGKGVIFVDVNELAATIQPPHILINMGKQNEIGLEIRKEILKKSLVVERLTSFFLASLLGIKNYKQSKTLGNNSYSISFNQKVDFLIEIGALSPETRSKFSMFMSIRNQFMHNIDASTFEKCISEISGAEAYLLKRYPQKKTLSKEEQLRLAVFKLSDEIVELTVAITEKVKEKKQLEADSKVLKLATRAFVDTISQIKKQLDDFVDIEISKSTTFKSERLKKLGTGLSKIIYKQWETNFKRLKDKQAKQ